MIHFDDSGFRNFQKKLNKLSGTHNVPASELFTDRFMRENTNFDTFQAMLEASGIENVEEQLDSPAFSDFVAIHSEFLNWEEMLKAAGQEWALQQLQL